MEKSENKTAIVGAVFEFKLSFTIPDGDEFIEKNPTIDEMKVWLEQLLSTEGMINAKAVPVKAELYY